MSAGDHHHERIVKTPAGVTAKDILVAGHAQSE